MEKKLFGELTLAEILKALPKLVTGYTDEYDGVAFLITINDDGIPPDEQKFSLLFDAAGGFELKLGHDLKTKLPVVMFEVTKQNGEGGLKTLLKLLLIDENKARMLLMMGWIRVGDGFENKQAGSQTLARTGTFFSRIATGNTEVLKAKFAEVGIEITDFDLKLKGMGTID